MPCSSLAYWTVTALRNVFDGAYATEIGPVSAPGVGLPGEGADAAGHVHDPRRRRAAQQRQHRVGDADDADHVGLHDRPHGREVDRGGLLRHAAGHAGVVDEHVEASGALLDQPGGGGHARVVGHVERNAERVDAGRAQLLHGGLAALLVAGADADAPAEGAQAGRDLVPDALVRAGDQRDRLSHSYGRSCPRAPAERPTPIGWAAIPRGYRSLAPGTVAAWRPGSCGTSSPSPRSCTSGGPRSGSGSRSRRCRGRSSSSNGGSGWRCWNAPAARVTLTEAGSVLLREGRAALDAVEAADRRTRRAALAATGHARPGPRHEGRRVQRTAGEAARRLRRRTRRGHRRRAPVRDRRAGTAAARRAGRRGAAAPAVRLDGRVRHRGAAARRARSWSCRPGIRSPAGPTCSMADVSALPDLPMPRWPGRDGTYPDGPGPQVRDHAQLFQLIALGRASAILAGVVPSPTARRPRRRAGAGRADGHDGDRLAAAQPVPGRRRPRPDRDASLTNLVFRVSRFRFRRAPRTGSR